MRDQDSQPDLPPRDHDRTDGDTTSFLHQVVDRRTLLKAGLVVTTTTVLAACDLTGPPSVVQRATPLPLDPTTVPIDTTVPTITAETFGPNPVDLVLRVNGVERPISLEPRVSLLDALREGLDLTGTKKGCNHGACGACTVLVDGQRVNACLGLAIQYTDVEITTIEGLAQGDELHPMQTAFIAHDAFQCGYCTAGQIMSAVALVEEGRTNSDDEIREWMSGNVCRCAAYPQIRAAIADVAQGAT